MTLMQMERGNCNMAVNFPARAYLRTKEGADEIAGIDRSAPLSLPALLSQRELEIAGHVAYGMSNKEIGQKLGISPWTVSAHLKRIFIKLSINRRVELCWLISHG